MKKVNVSEYMQDMQDEFYSKNKKIKERLEYLRGEIEKECISYGEITELQSLKKYIDKGDVVLLEWAGVKEHCENQDANGNTCWNCESRIGECGENKG